MSEEPEALTPAERARARAVFCNKLLADQSLPFHALLEKINHLMGSDAPLSAIAWLKFHVTPEQGHKFFPMVPVPLIGMDEDRKVENWEGSHPHYQEMTKLAKSFWSRLEIADMAFSSRYAESTEIKDSEVARQDFIKAATTTGDAFALSQKDAKILHQHLGNLASDALAEVKGKEKKPQPGTSVTQVTLWLPEKARAMDEYMRAMFRQPTVKKALAEFGDSLPQTPMERELNAVSPESALSMLAYPPMEAHLYPKNIWTQPEITRKFFEVLQFRDDSTHAFPTNDPRVSPKTQRYGRFQDATPGMPVWSAQDDAPYVSASTISPQREKLATLLHCCEAIFELVWAEHKEEKPYGHHAALAGKLIERLSLGYPEAPSFLEAARNAASQCIAKTERGSGRSA